MQNQFLNIESSNALSQSPDTIVLFPLDSAADLVLRGFSREHVRELSGVDPGYNNASIRGQLKGINVTTYRARHVSDRVQPAIMQQLLNDWGNNEISKSEAFAALGMPDLSERISLREILQQTPYSAAFVDVSNKRKKAALDSGRGRAIAGNAYTDADSNNTTREHTSFEHELYNALADTFGDADIVFDSVFGETFYIKSRDIYVKCMCGYEHGRHWFESDDADDTTHVEYMRSRNESEAIDIWTEQDVDIREQAREAGAALLCVWDDDLRDFRLWAALGAPTPHDWLCEGSWLDLNDVFAAKDDVLPKRGAGTSDRVTIRAARIAQRDVIFAREAQALADNAKYTHDRRALPGRLQLYVCARYFDYTHALPNTLTYLELLKRVRGAFVVLPYSCFRTRWLREALKETPAASVYDPCAGWGERMLCVCASGARYVGNDVNGELERGYGRLIKAYDLDADVSFGEDASVRDMRNGVHDAVVCCPPYGAKERYSEAGAENLSESEYAAWWAHVVEMSVAPTTVRFYLQIDSEHENVCKDVLLRAGFRLLTREVLYADVVRSIQRKMGVNRRKSPEVALIFEKDTL